MFTGIVEEVGRVASVQPGKLAISARGVLSGLAPGGSIAVNGVCLTVTSLTPGAFEVDIMSETLERTNLGRLTVGDGVNLERPLTMEKPLGGHLVQGHVDDTGRVAYISWEGGAMIVGIEASPEVMRYVVKKGFIAIDGISLTIVDFGTTSFKVSVVDYTREHTILGSWRVGAPVNLEVDIMAKYVERLHQGRRSGMTLDFLQEHGFIVS